MRTSEPVTAFVGQVARRMLRASLAKLGNVTAAIVSGDLVVHGDNEEN
jgi:hypothetical protein